MNVRAYTPFDLTMIQEWAGVRNVPIVPELLSPNGFIAEDESGPCAVAFVYLMFDVPIAVVDNFITRPGQGIKEALKAWRELFEVIKAFLLSLRSEDGPLNYRFIRTFCRTPIARYMKAGGWEIASHSSTQINYVIP